MGEKYRSRGSIPYLSDQSGSSLLRPTSLPSTMPGMFVPQRMKFSPRWVVSAK